MTEEERRSRSRDIPNACKLRLCRPAGYECTECGRVIFTALYISLPPMGSL